MSLTSQCNSHDKDWLSNSIRIVIEFKIERRSDNDSYFPLKIYNFESFHNKLYLHQNWIETSVI